ncbi:hypothetical protein ACFXDE_01895 [Kitasatospora sp. NPDC059408]|uniref:hypothetical protein n=1 Tax=Kitasatospora sp. NPDC059408 TaxID=3346823 RepID=UPI003699AB24
MTATVESQSATGQHRGRHRDPVEAALKTLVVCGHVVVLGLLGVLVEREQVHHQAVTATAAPDIEPPTTATTTKTPDARR